MSIARFVQISDTHVLTDPSNPPHGVDPNETLRQVVRRIAERPSVDFVVVTGDLIGDDRASSYAVLRALLSPLPGPVYVLAGNHDVRAALRAELGAPGPGRLAEQPRETRSDPYYYEFAHAGWRFLALDSQIPGEVSGRIDEAQMAWIAERCAIRPAPPTIVFVHHPPVPCGIGWLDPHRIENGPTLIAALREGNVRRVFFGHVHLPMTLSAGRLVCTSAPSTCYGFSDGRAGPVVIGPRPGLQVVELEGTEVRSHLEWV
ncbi:MAG: phosphodiesterase [Candidatus Eisenbacteria bacterium]|uniref:Phosphodiesterase n=1 Tax=Eiseniibacteriota bacterium TaxID=2212470 RepID=A0A956LW45_UNCEI|nr:phosphodiesterase [Candidatus Eisenbacteria bacterium]